MVVKIGFCHDIWLLLLYKYIYISVGALRKSRAHFSKRSAPVGAKFCLAKCIPVYLVTSSARFASGSWPNLAKMSPKISGFRNLSLYGLELLNGRSQRLAGMHLARQNFAPTGAHLYEKCARDFLSAPTDIYQNVSAIYQGKIRFYLP